MEEFANSNDVELVSMMLLATELRRFAKRGDIEQTDVSAVLDGISLFEFEASDYTAAGLLAGDNLRSLDALHVQGAIVLGADYVAAHDNRLIAACKLNGIRTISPGRTTSQ